MLTDTRIVDEKQRNDIFRYLKKLTEYQVDPKHVDKVSLYKYDEEWYWTIMFGEKPLAYASMKCKDSDIRKCAIGPLSSVRLDGKGVRSVDLSRAEKFYYGDDVSQILAMSADKFGYNEFLGGYCGVVMFRPFLDEVVIGKDSIAQKFSRKIA